MVCEREKLYVIVGAGAGALVLSLIAKMLGFTDINTYIFSGVTGAVGGGMIGYLVTEPYY